MSYFNFENTVYAMKQCIDALEENDYDLLKIPVIFSNVEHYDVVQFIKLCKEVSAKTSEEDNS